MAGEKPFDYLLAINSVASKKFLRMPVKELEDKIREIEAHINNLSVSNPQSPYLVGLSDALMLLQSARGKGKVL